MEAMAIARDNEKDSAMEQLREVIDSKEQLIQDLQEQMARLMGRLSEAEAKLFEM